MTHKQKPLMKLYEDVQTLWSVHQSQPPPAQDVLERFFAAQLAICDKCPHRLACLETGENQAE